MAIADEFRVALFQTIFSVPEETVQLWPTSFIIYIFYYLVANANRRYHERMKECRLVIMGLYQFSNNENNGFVSGHLIKNQPNPLTHKNIKLNIVRYY
ncbi:hypothetical protein BLOT_000155 [Blomia tropicalis]|nr:hypothetical protein BLOT_000155 [Blomia tropicalis]